MASRQPQSNRLTPNRQQRMAYHTHRRQPEYLDRAVSIAQACVPELQEGRVVETPIGGRAGVGHGGYHRQHVQVGVASISLLTWIVMKPVRGDEREAFVQFARMSLAEHLEVMDGSQQVLASSIEGLDSLPPEYAACARSAPTVVTSSTSTAPQDSTLVSGFVTLINFLGPGPYAGNRRCFGAGAAA